jgi:hypothetical protein
MRGAIRLLELEQQTPHLSIRFSAKAKFARVQELLAPGFEGGEQPLQPRFNIPYLNLAACQLNDADARYLLAHVKELSGVESLDLSNNIFGVGGFTAIARLLQAVGGGAGGLTEFVMRTGAGVLDPASRRALELAWAPRTSAGLELGVDAEKLTEADKVAKYSASHSWGGDRLPDLVDQDF